MGKAKDIESVCNALSNKGARAAAAILNSKYRFKHMELTKRSATPIECTLVFLRDGFIDRYTGEKLIFLPALRILSYVLKEEFPYHPNWKTDVTHPAYWQLAATIDHVVPVTHRGKDDPSNWVTTSMARNSAKANFTLEEIGWELKPKGDSRDWDGMLGWSLEYWHKHPEVVESESVRQWLRAGEKALAEMKARWS